MSAPSTGREINDTKMESSSGTGGKRLFIGNMSRTISEGDLIKLFSTIGTVKDVIYMWHKFGPNKGQPKGYAFVEMKDEAEASKGIARLNGVIAKGRKLYVSYASKEHDQYTSSSRTSGYSKHSNAYSGSKSSDRSHPIRGEQYSSQASSTNTGTGSSSSARSAVEEKMRRLQQALRSMEG
mmetsp:Transcript_18877/g.31585  ORF Transcript_18877/g.31585 Transcript_18877/m.31585 type:complete len:181 (+) Transcript_18877:179-721(+)